ncbi:tetratricopeptide repeat protein [Candidatus Uhrbacteria bacterium]|nr:tetratricopeptide repeat protein [Candidatus Uhrbacteria bacterium]MBD3283923.1 tetratricopeptide repeat protein [Candidatus Uhrbacteria bacterium]
MLLWISLILALVAIGTIAFVLWQRWTEIRMLDTDTIRKEQERKARDRIVRDRFDRMLKRVLHPLKHRSKQMARTLTRSVQRMEQQLAKTAGIEDTTVPQEESAQDPRRRIRRLLQDAQRLTEQGNYQQAERIYLEILKIDARHFEAYRGLGKLYLTARQYKQARETFDFLVRIQGANDEVFSGLGSIAEIEGNLKEAELMRKRALELNERSGQRHAELAALYMKMENADAAWRHAMRATELDPTSPQALELSVSSAILVRNRKEAEERYERLRLLRYDRNKLQRLREQLDGMD